MATDNEDIPLLDEEDEGLQGKAKGYVLLKQGEEEEEAEQGNTAKPKALLPKEAAPQGKTNSILSKEEALQQGKTEAILPKEETPQGQTKAILLKEEAPQGKTKALLLKEGADKYKQKAIRRDDLPVGWTADGLPLGHIGEGSVVGQPAARAPWGSGLFACLGQSDEFCGSDLEVCLLGTFVPCVLYGSNAERLGGTSGTFINYCLPYTALYLIGSSLFGSNYLAPWLSYTSRTATRQMFNLEGSFESLSRSCGCCQGMIEDDIRRESCETACDFATHFFCHVCALCQEGREIRRRLPHPAFNGRSVVVMLPPAEQAMDREA